MQACEAETARNGAGAIEHTKAFCPDLILLDIAMPAMDGFDVLRELRDTPCGQQSTIAAVTGYARPADKRRCAEAGVEYYFPKPVRFELLEQLIWLLDQSRALRQESCELAGRQKEALTAFIGIAIDMANTFLDVSTDVANAEVQRGCLAKAEKTHQRMTELVQSRAAERTDLLAALEELDSRCKQMRL